jgi:CobQ-like glutamine amidotransferase family enzyme
MKTIKIVHLYPKEMNIYGDNGNVLVLAQRLKWRHIPVEVVKIGVGQQIPSDAHMLIGGGGQDAGQLVIAKDLQQKAKVLRKMQNDGIPMLMICGMYQMFGHYFKTSSKEMIPGIGLLDIRTIAGDKRLIGNQTKPLGEVPGGRGNNGADNSEGARQNNVIGSYLHGPILAKSPKLADHLLELAVGVAGYATKLSSLDDSLENAAAKVAAGRNR